MEKKIENLCLSCTKLKKNKCVADEERAYFGVSLQDGQIVVVRCGEYDKQGEK